MTITRTLRYLMVSVLLAIGAFALILPTQAQEATDSIESSVTVSEETTETSDPGITSEITIVEPVVVDPIVESSDISVTISETEANSEGTETETAVSIVENADELFPEIDVVTTAKTSETVTVGGVTFIAGNAVEIENADAADIFAAGQTISVNEKHTGDLFAAGNTININNPVAGSVRVAGNTVTINTQIERNVLVFANTVYIGSEAQIDGHANIYASTVVYEGAVEQTLSVAAETATINGSVMGTTQIDAYTVRIDGDAFINAAGEINSPQEPSVSSTAIGAELLEYTYSTFEGDDEDRRANKNQRLVERAQKWTVSFFFFLLVGGLMILIWPQWTNTVATTMEKEFGQSTQKGFVYLFLVPFLLFAAMVTILLIPAAALTAPLYILTIVLARIFVGMLLGRHVVNKKFKNAKKQLLLEFAVGYFIVSILFSLPLIGCFLAIIGGAWGMGGVLQNWANYRAANKKPKAKSKKKK